jgi:predicted metal-binding membrane protein
MTTVPARLSRPLAGHVQAGVIFALLLLAAVSGYVATWALAGLLGYVIVESARSLDVGFLAWDQAGRYIAGGVILGAGAYQLSRLKNA